jgi:protein-disulfide isomerase
VGRQAHADRVRQDFVGGIRSGVDGTPTLFVNEVRHDGGYDLADLLAAVDAAANP